MVAVALVVFVVLVKQLHELLLLRHTQDVEMVVVDKHMVVDNMDRVVVVVVLSMLLQQQRLLYHHHHLVMMMMMMIVLVMMHEQVDARTLLPWHHA